MCSFVCLDDYVCSWGGKGEDYVGKLEGRTGDPSNGETFK